MTEEYVIIALIFLLIAGLMIVGPIATIWSLNTLFGLEISYSFKSWVAVAWLMAILNGIRTKKQS